MTRFTFRELEAIEEALCSRLTEAASHIEALEARVKTVEGEREAGLNRMDPDRDYAGVSLAEAIDEFTEEHIETWTSEARRWKARAQTAEQSLAEARVALEPFTKAYLFWDAVDGGVHDDIEIDDQGMIKIAHCRLAASTLAKLGGNTSS